MRLRLLAVVVVIALLGGCASAGSDEAVEREEEAPQAGREEASSEVEQSGESEPQAAEETEAPELPGIAPADVYLNLERQPYGLDFGDWQRGELFASRYGRRFDLDTSADLGVYVYSRTGTDVVWVEAGVMGKDLRAAAWLLPYVATLPFDGNDPKASSDWVAQNWEKVSGDKSITREVESAVFELYGDGEKSVFLSIKAKGLAEWMDRELSSTD